MTVQEFKEHITKYEPKLNQLYKGKYPKGQWIKYHRIFCGFDIETTSQNEKSFMYIWQFSFMTDTLPCVVVKGRKWYEFLQLLDFLRKYLALRDSTRIIVWVANLGYEFSFIRKRIDVDFLFAKKSRNPLIIDSKGIEFRECLSISQGSLAYLAKTWTTTQKAVSDLDYSIKRNSKTILTDKENGYCDNDVIILAEFSKRIFDEYIVKEKYIPITSTGILRHDLRNKIKKTYGKKINRYNAYIKSLFPKTKEDYIFIMEYLFRGGYVHSNHRYTNIVLYNMDSYDLKSSYPAVAFQCYYPVSEFLDVNTENVSCETLQQFCDNYCCIFTVTFENIQATTTHSIESKSKCINCKGATIDNGRIFKAESITVFLTELDFESYKKFYTWDSMTIHSLAIAKRGELPKELLDSFYFWFERKESIEDKESQDYAICKTRINGHFGMCVTRLVFNEVSYIDGEWKPKESDTPYEEMIAEQILSPYWGIYITAHGRFRELDLLYKLMVETAYSDTDSHKVLQSENVQKVVEEYNAMIDKLNIEICNKYGYDYKILGNIGKFECETKNNHITRFKTLGAKRYLTEYADGTIKATISGLPKKSLETYCKKENKDPFKIFENNMCIDSKYTNKLVSMYIDEEVAETITDEQGNTELMHEKSCLYLKPSSFNLCVEKSYLELLLYWIERNEKHG